MAAAGQMEMARVYGRSMDEAVEEVFRLNAYSLRLG